jgi:hypothetical protein
LTFSFTISDEEETETVVSRSGKHAHHTSGVISDEEETETVVSRSGKRANHTPV